MDEGGEKAKEEETEVKGGRSVSSFVSFSSLFCKRVNEQQESESRSKREVDRAYRLLHFEGGRLLLNE